MMMPKLHGGSAERTLGNYVWGGQKKCGAESSDPNRHSQPRLPGSVVGEASMRQVADSGKITKVSALQITEAPGQNEQW